MVYTILGAFLGGIVTYALCKWNRVSFANTYIFSDAFMYIAVGTFIGAGAGFGYGIGALAHGTHIVQRLWK